MGRSFLIRFGCFEEFRATSFEFRVGHSIGHGPVVFKEKIRFGCCEEFRVSSFELGTALGMGL
jgi:hypothetical protein